MTMGKQLRIRILPDGRIQAETVGVKGPACTSYVHVLENLLDADAVESQYTNEYYESEPVAEPEVSLERLSEG